MNALIAGLMLYFLIRRHEFSEGISSRIGASQQCAGIFAQTNKTSNLNILSGIVPSRLLVQSILS